MHDKPCTSPKDNQCLSGSNIIEVINLENIADNFVACSSKLDKGEV